MTALLQGHSLGKSYKHGRVWVKALHSVSFALQPGETLGVVGASGCGKSTLARIIVGLQTPDQGSLLWQGVPLTLPRSKANLRDISMVFQSPVSSLDPRMPIEDIVAEPLDVQMLAGTRRERQLCVSKSLEDVGLDPSLRTKLPRELSGGQHQRVAIARALCTRPRLLVADEPLSSLDVSVAAQIANLFMDLQNKFGLAYIFISHDLNMVAHLSHSVLKMDQQGNSTPRA